MKGFGAWVHNRFSRDVDHARRGLGKSLDMLAEGVLLLYVDSYGRVSRRARNNRVASGNPLCDSGLGGLLRTYLYVVVGAADYIWVEGKKLDGA